MQWTKSDSDGKQFSGCVYRQAEAASALLVDLTHSDDDEGESSFFFGVDIKNNL